MINDEKHTIYELSSSYSSSDDDGPILSFSLSLKVSQGFSWNQDLFASEYQQSRANDDDDQSEDDKETSVQDNIKVIHQKRRHSANNSRDGYNCVEVSEIIVDDDGFEE
ncbi:hypothetical protein DASC09_064180 [Saccharomycopsis crataegensis]|uniref:Uncharacterized protein n=1 Tax=Saccharomycopsis crataegensis TaxID=43959 RepID=A0AAV5QWA5_9ASCO|nr:hypothetical protein DASC09_064180 [Saccharomycopsis crataegensis]